MIDNLLKSGLYEVETRVSASKSGTIEKLYIRYLPQPQECPRCGSPKIIKKTLSRHVIIDIQGNQPIEVTITKQRSKCQCGQTFIMKDESDYPERIHISKDASDLLGTMILEEPDLSITQAGEMLGVGRTTASEALHQKIKELRDQTFSVAPCIKISYIPFFFTNKERCAVAGIDSSGKSFLLDILDEYSVEQLSRFYPKTEVFRSDIQASFCKLASDITESLHNQYPIDIGILHRCISQLIKQARGNRYDALYTDRYDALYNLDQTMRHCTYNHFPTLFFDWQKSLSSDLKKSLQELIETVNSFLRECSVTTKYTEMDTSFTKLMKIISKQRKDRTTFDTMVFRLLYANQVALSSPNGPHIWNSINSMMAPIAGSMSEFGVDIDALYEDIFDGGI